MKVLHITSSRNARYIDRNGLKSQLAKGKLKTVWVCTPGLLWWAVQHTERRHGKGKFVVAVLDVPRTWLKKGRRKGTHHTAGRDVPWKMFKKFYLLETADLMRPA